MIRTPLVELLDRAAGGYRPTAADYEALPLRPGAAAEVQQAIAKTTSSVQLLRRTGEYVAARRLCRTAAGDLARHLAPTPAEPTRRSSMTDPEEHERTTEAQKARDMINALVAASDQAESGGFPPRPATPTEGAPAA